MSMSVFVHVRACVFVWVYVNMCACEHLYIWDYVNICACVCLGLSEHERVCVCVYECVHG